MPHRYSRPVVGDVEIPSRCLSVVARLHTVLGPRDDVEYEVVFRRAFWRFFADRFSRLGSICRWIYRLPLLRDCLRLEYEKTSRLWLVEQSSMVASDRVVERADPTWYGSSPIMAIIREGF